jgi:hypothetical protein
MRNNYSQDELILKVLEGNGKNWTPGYELIKKEIWLGCEKHFLGSSADRRARELAEYGKIERKREGKFVYFRLNQEKTQVSMFDVIVAESRKVNPLTGEKLK